MERLYNELFQLVWHTGKGYIGMRFENTGGFRSEWSKELSELVGNGHKYKVDIAAFCTVT